MDSIYLMRGIFMGYKSVIDIKKGTPKETLISLLAMADKAFDNHAGTSSN